MLDDETPTQADSASEQAPAAPRRRRAASRPAGPPAAVVAGDTASQPVSESLVPAAAEEAPAAAAEPKPARTRRSRAKQPSAEAPETAAAQPDVAAPAAEAPATKPKTAKAKASKASASKAGAVEPAAEAPDRTESDDTVQTPSRGSTGGRKTKKPTTARANVAADEADQAPTEAIAPEPEPEPAGPAEGSERTAAPTVRRGRRRAPHPADENESAASGAVAASLAELEQRAPGRRGRVRAEAFGLAEDADPEAVLNSLAAAIGGAVPAQAVLDEDEDDEGAELDPDALADEDAEAADAEDEAEDAEDSEDDAGPGSARRRRRRRGGRRRRRSSGGEDAEDSEAEGDVEADETAGDDATEAEPAEAGEAGEGGSRRRRRRRRRGEDSGEAEDDSIDVVVRVREPRRRTANDEVTGIEGSTRMEAKKQRRREGRAAGRRRTPILSESEFLARRESVDRVMLIRQAEEYSQIAVLEDGILVEHYVDRPSATSMIGNIYLGRVQNVLPSMEAAFVDIGRGRNAVLYAGEVDWASFGVTGQDKKVEKVFKSGQSVLVQVTKDPVGAKGARLTSHISVPGRYVVYSPGGQLSGISRKLPEPERKRLKAILDELIGPDASVIVRTAAEGASEEELVRDVNRLKAQWEVIEKKTSGSAPSLLYGEPDLTVRIVRDLFTEDFRALIVDGNGSADDAGDTIEAYVKHVAPHLMERMQRWDRAASGDIFDAHRVHEQVAKALERKVFLPSGGSLIIDRTEAMTVIDVNTGRFTGTSGNLEATVTSNNLEAAEEIVRQLRLRDIGGIIVIDFIDMVLPTNRELLLRRLVECLGRDRTRHQVAEVTSLGLVQMTRKKIGTGLAEAFTVPCETCKGRGYHTHDVPVATQAPADGGEREGNRRGRGSNRSNNSGNSGSSGSGGNNPRNRRPGVAPELAAVVAATLAHPVTPALTKSAESAPEEAADALAAEPSEAPVAEPGVRLVELVESPADGGSAEYVEAREAEGEPVVSSVEPVETPVEAASAIPSSEIVDVPAVAADEPVVAPTDLVEAFVDPVETPLQPELVGAEPADS